MLVRIGVVVLSLAASAIVVGGPAAARAGGCSSAQPKWGFTCVSTASNVTLASCLKDAPLWSDRAECVPRNDGSGRYDLWVP